MEVRVQMDAPLSHTLAEQEREDSQEAGHNPSTYFHLHPPHLFFQDSTAS